MSHGQSYEIEIRFCVASLAEASALLPFFEQSLRTPKSWATDIIGRDLYESGRLLRLGRTISADGTRYTLGYKGPDLGTIANIRQEWGEEITEGIEASAILPMLGLAADYPTCAAVVDALYTAGYTPFMDFAGVDRLGYDAPLDLHTKLCRCEAILDQQYLIELEMTATSLEEARIVETRLQAIAEEYHLTDLLFRDEPPTMLYQRRFGQAAGN